MLAKRRRVLVVEDEMIVALMVEDRLTDLGHDVVGPAMRLQAGLALAREADVDVAVLDVNLGDAKSFPIAEILQERGIPFLFATGYGREGLEGAFEDTVVIQKPFESEQLQRAVDQALC